MFTTCANLHQFVLILPTLFSTYPYCFPIPAPETVGEGRERSDASGFLGIRGEGQGDGDPRLPAASGQDSFLQSHPKDPSNSLHNQSNSFRVLVIIVFYIIMIEDHDRGS